MIQNVFIKSVSPTMPVTNTCITMTILLKNMSHIGYRRSIILPGCDVVYRSSCRNGIEFTTLVSLDGYIYSDAVNSPELLLRLNNRGVKLNFPGSVKRKQIACVLQDLKKDF